MAVKITASLDDKVSPELQKMEKALGETGKEADEFRESFRKAASDMGVAGDEMTKLDKKIDELAKSSRMTGNEIRSNLMKELDARKVSRFRSEIQKTADSIDGLGKKGGGKGGFLGAGLIGGVAGGIASKAVDIMKEKFMEAGVKSAINDAFSLDEPLGRAAKSIDEMTGKLLHWAGLLSDAGFADSIGSEDAAKNKKLDEDRAKRNLAAVQIEAGKQKALEQEKEAAAKRELALMEQKADEAKSLAEAEKKFEDFIFQRKKQHEQQLADITKDRLEKEEQQQLEMLRVRDEKMRASAEKEKARLQSVLDIMKAATGGGTQPTGPAAGGRMGLEDFSRKMLEDVKGSKRGQREIEREARRTAFSPIDKEFDAKEAAIRAKNREYIQSTAGVGGRPSTAATMDTLDVQRKELAALSKERDAARTKAFSGLTQGNRDDAALRVVGSRAKEMGFNPEQSKAIVASASATAETAANTKSALSFLQQIANNSMPKGRGGGQGLNRGARQARGGVR